MIKKIRTIQTGDPDSISIILVGCGGTGSFAALNLARLVWADRQDKRFRLVFVDPDVVEEKNIGRQYFCPADVGKPKARTLASRLALAYGLEITPVVGRFEAEMVMDFRPYHPARSGLTLVVGAVDTPAARRDIAGAMAEQAEKSGYRGDQLWWLDAGNGHTTGQVLIGNSSNPHPLMTEFGDCVAVPFPSVQEPVLVRDAAEEEHAGLSCAELMALNVQARTIDAMMANWLDVFAERLIVSRDLNLMGVYVNQAQGIVTPAPIVDCRPVKEERGKRVTAATITAAEFVRGRAAAQPYPEGYPADEDADDGDEEFGPCPNCGRTLAAGEDTVNDELVDIVFCTDCDWEMEMEEYERAMAAPPA